MQSKYAHHATQKRMVRNILTVYRQTTHAERAQGMAWYSTAQRGCDIWAAKYGVDARTVASVIAALSPQCEWMANLQAALSLIAGQPIPTTGQSRPLQANQRKAEAILRDDATLPDAYFIEGYKVRAFARNLQGDEQTVTVDTHASQIALADMLANPRIERRPHYDAFAAAYQDAASYTDIAPCQLQACTWLTWKRLYPAGRKRALRRYQS